MIVLVRLDERLIHGQVVVGWRAALGLTAFVVVDDQLAASDWERELVLAGVPDDATGEVVEVSQAAERWHEWQEDTQRRAILAQTVHTLIALYQAGVPLARVNVGGVHKRSGRREFLGYVHLDEEEIAACRHLCAEGVSLEAQDVPGTSPVNLCTHITEKR